MSSISSELEIEPDLNKAPPHVEGELLKQNTNAYLGKKKGWKKYYFIILKDKLQYYKKREDVRSLKDPIAFVRMSQVIEITEVIFSGVPHKNHLNSGFSLEAYHPITRERQTYNLLAETPEDMRYWVHALRYVKAYWSKMEVRDTVLSEEQERRILDQIFKEEEEEQEEVLVGEYSLNEEGSTSSPNEESRSSMSVTVHFADGAKVKVTMSPLDTTSDLLEHVLVKDHLTSSAAQLWLVDSEGDDRILESEDHPTHFLPKAYKFYALDPTRRVLVVFINRKAQDGFECVAVSNKATVSDLLEDRDISVKLDLKGVDNRGLFLREEEEEHLFTNSECPCDALFQSEASGRVIRLDIGYLLIKNKTLGGPKRTKKPSRIRTMRRAPRSNSEEEKMLSLISEEEDAQSRAIDMVILKKQLMIPSVVDERSCSIEKDWVDISTTEFPVAPLPAHFAHRASDPFPLDPINPPSSALPDHRGFDEAVLLEPAAPRSASLEPTGLARSGSRPRASKLVGDFRRSPVHRREKSPSHSPTLDSPRRGSRSKSPRRLPDRPLSGGGAEKSRTSPPKGDENSTPPGANSTSFKARNSPLQRRNATRLSVSERRAPPPGGKTKGPTIRLAEEKASGVRSLDEPVSRLQQRTRSPTLRRSKFVESLSVNDSRSSAFGANTPPTSAKSLTTEMAFNVSRRVEVEEEDDHAPSPAPNSDDEQRLDELFSRSAQLEEEESRSRSLKTVDTLSQKYQSVVATGNSAVPPPSGSEGDKDVAADEGPLEVRSLPTMIINFAELPSIQASSTGLHGDETMPSKQTAAITITSPSFLKVILLQSSAASAESGPMDLISLSGVTLQNDRGTWHIQEGNNFHDPLPFDCEDHTETIPLPGGIRAVFNHSHKRWHVLPPPLSTPTPTPSGDDSRSIADSAEHDGMEGSIDEGSLYLSKKVIITELASAFHAVMKQFESTRDIAEKRRIGSDMTNASMGHMVRVQLCSALAKLMLDGMKPYRLNGLVVDDIWKVTVAFCSEAQSKHNTVVVFPAFDKLIFQPIASLKTLMKDNNVKFRTFVCLAMSKGMLTNWLEALPKQKDVLRKYYLPHSLLRLASERDAYSTLYHQMLLALEPMLHLPFDLTVDFENRQMLEAMCAPQEGEGVGQGAESEDLLDSAASSEQGSPSQLPRTPQRQNVVIKTHAATGQTTTAGNVINAVWHPSPSKSPDQHDKQNPTLEKLESQLKLPVISETTPTVSQAPPTASKATHTATTKKSSFFQKLVQQLNVGGAITGRPRDTQATPTSNSSSSREPVPGKQTTTEERSVVALYPSIVEDSDELGFAAGDVLVVKEQINRDWLICCLNGRTGIVPVNYVKAVP